MSINDIPTFVFMYVVEIAEYLLSRFATICNNSLLATAGKLQKVGTDVLGNNVKTVISGLDLFSSASAKWTKSMYVLSHVGKITRDKICRYIYIVL